MKQDTLWVDKEPASTHKTSGQKYSVAFTLAAVLLACVLSVCLALFGSLAAFVLVQPLLFLAAGSLHLYQMESESAAKTTVQKWIYTAAVAAAIAFLFFLASAWRLHLPLIGLLAAPAAFLLPAVLSEVLQTYLQLAFGHARTWKPTKEAAITYPDVYMAGVPVRFNIVTGQNDGDNFQTTFRALADMKLGEVFCNMAQKQNKKEAGSVALFDEDKELYHWAFYTRSLLAWGRALDPALSLEENGLGKKSVIYAQRLPADATALLQEAKASNYLA